MIETLLVFAFAIGLGWPLGQHDTHYLRIIVGKLRHKLGDDAVAPRYIATEPGVGLRFVGEVRDSF